MDLNEILTSVEEGEMSPLEAFVKLRAESDKWIAGMEKVKRQAIAEASIEDEKSFEKFGAKITYVESAGSRWDFSGIPEWKEKKEEMAEIEMKHKAAYQAWKRGQQYVDEDGVAVTPAAFKEGNSTIQVKVL